MNRYQYTIKEKVDTKWGCNSPWPSKTLLSRLQKHRALLDRGLDGLKTPKGYRSWRHVADFVETRLTNQEIANDEWLSSARWYEQAITKAFRSLSRLKSDPKRYQDMRAKIEKLKLTYEKIKNHS